jgi:hypothetical protein
MSTYMRPNSGKGKELQDLLRRELGIPESVKWFQVRFAMDELVSVTCEYYGRTEEEPWSKSS